MKKNNFCREVNDIVVEIKKIKTSTTFFKITIGFSKVVDGKRKLSLGFAHARLVVAFVVGVTAVRFFAARTIVIENQDHQLING